MTFLHSTGINTYIHKQNILYGASIVPQLNTYKDSNCSPNGNKLTIFVQFVPDEIEFPHVIDKENKLLLIILIGSIIDDSDPCII